MHAAFCVGRLKRIPEMLPDTDDTDNLIHNRGSRAGILENA